MSTCKTISCGRRCHTYTGYCTVCDKARGQGYDAGYNNCLLKQNHAIERFTSAVFKQLMDKECGILTPEEAWQVIVNHKDILDINAKVTV